MALAMEPNLIRELTAGSPGRHTEPASGPPPFSNSRLRSYAGRVESLLDPKTILSSSVALTGAGLADPFPPTATAAAAAAVPGPSNPRGLPPPQLLQSHSHVLLQQHPYPQQGAPVTNVAAGTAPTSGPSSGGTLPAGGEYHQALGAQHHARFAAAPLMLTGGSSSSLPSAGRFPAGQLPTAPVAAWPPPPQQPPPPPHPAASTEDLAAALSQIRTLKAEIAGVETVLGYLKGSETSTTTMGRKAHKLPSQEQLRIRADALAVGRAAARLRSGTGGGGSTGAVEPVLLSPLRSSLGHAPGGWAATAGAPVRAKSAGEASSGGAAVAAGVGGAAGGGVFEVLAAETKLGRTWRAPRGPQPVGRGEAVILEAALDEALPPGAITAKYGRDAHVELSFWSGGDVRRDFEMLEMVQREVARQVSVSCVERGRIIDKLADRHAEIFAALAAAAKSSAEGQLAVFEQVEAARARAAEQASEIASLRSELATRGAETEDLREQLAEATTAHEHYVWDNEQEVEQLQAQADILAEQVEHLHVRLSEAVAEKDAALSRGLERLEAELEAVRDERDDLSQRIRFLERQLHKLRTEMNMAAATSVAEVQTDPVEWGPTEEEDVPDDNSDTPSLAEIRARYLAHGYDALTPEERMRLGLPPHMGPDPSREVKGRKRRRALGQFEGLISSDRPGRVRGLPWTINAMSAIYYDKLQADSVSDREGNPRQRLAEFAVDWHMTRFGLRNLAELNLLDLIASVRQHYKASVRVRWFGQFTGLVEVGDQVDTTPHVSFYLTVLSQLAAPNSLVSLFPDTAAGGEDGGNPPVAIKAAVLPEAIKTIFRYLNEPESAVPFLARAVDPLTDPDTQLAPLDPLVALLMAEYQRRWERNAAHLRALFRAADYDDDGLIGFDEFVAILRQLMPDSGDRTISKMYGDAVRRLPPGQSLVDVETFMTVVRAFGWDRWRIDVSPLAPSSSSSAGGAGALASRPSSRWPSSASAAAPPSSAGPSSGGAIISRAASTALLGLAASAGSLSLSAAASLSPRGPSPGSAGGGGGGGGASFGPARSVSNLRREDSVVGLSDADRALLRVLDGALEALDPPLEDQVEALLERLRATLAAAAQQAAVAAAAVAAVPGLDLGSSGRELNAALAADTALLSKLEGQYAHFRTVYDERTDPAAAWLAFRMLLASLAAATGGPRGRTSHSRSRPGSAKGSAGWGASRTSMRLTVPSLPFRAGSGSLGHLSRLGSRSPMLLGPAPGAAGPPGLSAVSAVNSSVMLGSGCYSGSVVGFGTGLERGDGGFTPGAAGSLPLVSGTGAWLPLQSRSGARSPDLLGMGVGMGVGAAPPLQPRGGGRPPEALGQPMPFAQMTHGAGSPGHGSPGAATGADRLTVSSPSHASSPSPTALNRSPLGAAAAGRIAATAALSSVITPQKRGVVFALGGGDDGGDGNGGGGGSGGGAAATSSVEPAALSLYVVSPPPPSSPEPSETTLLAPPPPPPLPATQSTGVAELPDAAEAPPAGAAGWPAPQPEATLLTAAAAEARAAADEGCPGGEPSSSWFAGDQHDGPEAAGRP